MLSNKVQDLILTAINMETRSLKNVDVYFKRGQLFVSEPNKVNTVRKLVKQLNLDVDVVSIEEEVCYA